MGAAPPSVLDSIRHAAAGKDAEPFEREAGPGAVTRVEVIPYSEHNDVTAFVEALARA
jgi:hypothetical protein